MKSVNAYTVRTKFGQVLAELEADNLPIILTKDHEEKAVLIPMELYRRRFSDFITEDGINTILARFQAVSSKGKPGKGSLAELRKLRGHTK